MSNTITGYQWGDDGSYIGPYTFPNNGDQEAVHLPPRTTNIAPPTDIPPGHEAAFDEVANAWVIRLEDLGWMATETPTDPGKP